MKFRTITALVIAPALVAGILAVSLAAQNMEMEVVELARLNVTSGTVLSPRPPTLELRAAVIRAEMKEGRPSAATLDFTYHGDGSETVPLTSGELRRQIGLKLRAQDTCNVVYVMWRIAPTAGIHVSVKANPGMSRHAQCGDQGYTSLTPDSPAAAIAPIAPGVPRVLAARIEGETMIVTVDGQEAWRGQLPPAAFGFDGPAGFRSDNGIFDVVMKVAP